MRKASTPGPDCSAAAPPLDPEEGRQFEVGTKWDIAPTLGASLSVFEITKTNIAIDDPLDGAFGLQTGEQRARGVEAELAGEILTGRSVHSGLGYLEAEVTEDNTIAVGNRLAGVPHMTASLWTTHTMQNITFGGGITHVGLRKGDLENSFEVEVYTRLDAMARYAFDNGATLSLAVNNLTDDDYIVSTQSDREIVAGAPRNVQLKLGMAF